MSVSKNKLVENIFRVMTSRGIMLISEMLLGFVIPKILGVTGYGYLKTYSLYTAYSALLHFGFVDGILLRFAGQDYETLNKEEIRAYSMFFIGLQAIVGCILLIVGMSILNDDMKFIVGMLAVNTFVMNLTSYYQYISQATQRFKELSFRNILIAIAKIILVIILVCIYQVSRKYVSYKWYIILINIIEGFLMLWYVYTYKDILFGKRISIKQCKKEIIGCMKNGFSLTIAYQVAHLVFILDKQFVSILYSAEVFALYSFAYSLVSVCTKILSTLSTVLFPMLKKMEEEIALKYFSSSISLMLILSGIVLAGFFPITWIIRCFLPMYEESLIYLRVILKALLLNCCISVLIFTYYKVINKNMIYFKVSCIVLGISTISNAIAHFLWKSAIAISWASVISMIIWYVLAEIYFIKAYNVKWKRNLIYAGVVIAIFYAISSLNITLWNGLVLYFISYMIVTMLFFRNTEILKYFKVGRLKNK